jgi:hypothetical protein
MIGTTVSMLTSPSITDDLLINIFICQKNASHIIRRQGSGALMTANFHIRHLKDYITLTNTRQTYVNSL